MLAGASAYASNYIVSKDGLNIAQGSIDYDVVNAIDNNFCSSGDCYGSVTQKRLQASLTNPNTVITFNNKKDTDGSYSNYQVRAMQDQDGNVIGYSAYNPNTDKNILMKPEELTAFKGLVENNLMSIFENAPNYEHTTYNAINGLHDDGQVGGVVDSWKQYAKSGDIIFDLATGLGGGVAVGTSKVVGKLKAIKIARNINIKLGSKITKQMPNRGWSKEDVVNTITKPSKKVKWKDVRWNPETGKKNNEPATAFYNKDGSYVVKNDITGDIVQVSNKTKADWKVPWD